MIEIVLLAALTIAICVMADRRVFSSKHVPNNERFPRSLLTDGSDLITVVDANGYRTFVSESYRRVLGYNPRDLLGRSILDFVHPDDLPEVRAQLSAPRRLGVKQDWRLRVKHADGSWRWLNVTARNRLDDTTVRGFLVTARDETRLSNLEANLIQARRAEAAGRLAASIAHDLNNLLTVVIGDLAVLSELHLGGEDRVVLHEAKDAAGRACGLSKQLLRFSRGQSSAPRSLRVNDVLRGMLRLLERLVGPGIELEVELDPQLPLILADHAQVEQAILNLVVNARDAMATGGRVMIVTTQANLAQRGEYVVIDVKDSGPGIDPKIISNIFDPHFTTKEVDKGTGIGLAIVADIMKQSGGCVDVKSVVGSGSCFTLYFPAKPEGK